MSLTASVDLAQLDHRASVHLLKLLRSEAYRFVTPTPATHQRVLKSLGRERAADIRDVLGWSLPFTPELLSAEVFAALEATGALQPVPEGFRSGIRVSSLDDDLFIHSAFPPEADDTVFLGPDTYRFARLLKAVLAGDEDVGHMVDVGTGSAAGAVVAARACRPARISATDVNETALAAARINLAAAGVEADLRCGSGLSPIEGSVDLIIANPPFIAGEGGRTYRDGGDMLGARLSLDWALAAAERLAPGGRFVLYTGTAIVDGKDALHAALIDRLDPRRHDLSYEELDPDIFGEQLAEPAYHGVDRIAAIGAVIRRR